MNNKISQLYLLILKNKWYIKKSAQIRLDYFPRDVMVVEIELELSTPHGIREHYTLLGPEGTSHG